MTNEKLNLGAALSQQKADYERAADVNLVKGWVKNYPATNNPMDPAPLLALFDTFKGKIGQMLEEAEAIEVVDDDSSARVAEMAGQARQLHNVVEKKRKQVTQPYQDVKSTVDAECRSIKDAVLSIQRMLEAKNKPYLLKKENERLEAERAAAAEAARIQAELDRKAKEKAEARAAAAEAGEVESVFEEPEIEVEVVADAAPEAGVKTDSGSQAIDYALEPVLIDVRQISDACIKARQSQIESAVLPWARAQIKAGVTNIPGFKVVKRATVKTRAAAYKGNSDKF